jgi:hypothetical protein
MSFISKKKKNLFLVAISLLMISGYPQENKNEYDFSALTGPYLGQKPPDLVPKRFDPFDSKDLNEFIFFDNGRKCIISKKFQLFYTEAHDKKWLALKRLDFGNYNNAGLFGANISPNGKIIYYNSLDRPLPEGVEKPRCPIWVSLIEGEKALAQTRFIGFGGMYPTATSEGTLYFTLRKDGVDCIARREYYNNEYRETEIVPPPVFSEKFHDQHPFIAPNESYLIFDSENRSKKNGCALFVSFKKPDGSWTEPTNMGVFITQKNAAMARVTTDGKYLFYGDADGYTWWISTKIFEKLKSAQLPDEE